MSLQPLINGQILKIDNHYQGNNIPIDWKKGDIHIHKETIFKIKGKRQKLIIRLPINSDKKYSITGRGNTHEIPRKLKKEVEEVLENANTRAMFIEDLIDCLKNFSQDGTREKTEKALERLAKHFDLRWTGEEIKRYIDDTLVSHTRVYKSNDKNNRKEFYEKITKSKQSEKVTFEIGENSGYAKETNRIGR